jgi:hypothetical protein
MTDETDPPETEAPEEATKKYSPRRPRRDPQEGCRRPARGRGSLPVVRKHGLLGAGGPPLVTKDVDFCVKPDRALQALGGAGMPTERPPEGWLYKAWDGDILIDLLFCPADVPVTDEVLEHGDELTVMSVPMRVAAIDDVISTKLLALNEHSLDLEQYFRLRALSARRSTGRR